MSHQLTVPNSEVHFANSADRMHKVDTNLANVKTVLLQERANSGSDGCNQMMTKNRILYIGTHSNVCGPSICVTPFPGRVLRMAILLPSVPIIGAVPPNKRPMKNTNDKTDKNECVGRLYKVGA